MRPTLFRRPNRFRLTGILAAWTLLLVLIAVFAGPRAAAQGPRPFSPSANPVTDAVRELAGRESKNLIGSAELMPADKYSYAPTPPQMTFGALMAHVAQTNMVLCAIVSRTMPPLAPPDLKSKLTGREPKDALVPMVKQSFDYCVESLSKVRDSDLAEEAEMFGQRTGMSRGAALVTIATDWTDHYSTAASYLRLNGILPPTAQPKP